MNLFMLTFSFFCYTVTEKILSGEVDLSWVRAGNLRGIIFPSYDGNIGTTQGKSKEKRPRFVEALTVIRNFGICCAFSPT